jgi:sulfite exporter TauE/SafE
MVYVALFGALAMPNVSVSVLYMLLFGIGTIPMMSAVVLISNLVSIPIRNNIQKVIPVLAVVIGLLFIMRGMGLDIPYLSPSNISLFVQNEAHCH